MNSIWRGMVAAYSIYVNAIRNGRTRVWRILVVFTYTRRFPPPCRTSLQKGERLRACILEFRGIGYTFPAERPWMRIDRVLGADGVRFLSAEVGARGASDHRSLRVRFELE